MSIRKVPVFFGLIVVSLMLLALMPAAAQEKTTITWLTLAWNDRNWQKVVTDFEAANPTIHVEIESVPFNDLFTQIQVRLGAKSATPDVISVDVPLVAGYGLRN